MAELEGIQLVLDTTHNYPGSLVKGRVLVSAGELKSYKQIHVNFWRGTKMNLIFCEDLPHFIRRIYGAHMQVHEDYANGDVRLNDDQVTLWRAAEDSSIDDMPIGEHSFAFSFPLPHNVPPSYEGPYGHVKYEVEATVVQTLKVNTCSDFEHKIPSGFIVEDIISPELLRLRSVPVAENANETKELTSSCLNRSQGSITATVNMPRTGFSPGEVVPITVSLSNESSRRIRVVSSIVRGDRYSSATERSEELTFAIAKTISSHIDGGISTSFEDRCLTIPTDVGTTSKRNLSVEYYLEVTV